MGGSLTPADLDTGITNSSLGSVTELGASVNNLIEWSAPPFFILEFLIILVKVER